jgi:hypothetical protein
MTLSQQESHEIGRVTHVRNSVRGLKTMGEAFSTVFI